MGVRCACWAGSLLGMSCPELAGCRLLLHIVLAACVGYLPDLAWPDLAWPGLPVQVSNTVLRRCMRCLPGLRDKMAGAFATFVVHIQEDYPEVVKDSLALLLRWVLQVAG